MYIFDGNPNGRIMCELSNWNGRIYKVSRNELSVFSQRADAENTGVYFLLGIVDADFHFVKDHIFTSPSLAAAVVLGRNANGRTEWKTAGNKALRDVEEDELA